MMTVREEDLEEAVEGRSSEIGIVVEQVQFFRKREYLHCIYACKKIRWAL